MGAVLSTKMKENKCKEKHGGESRRNKREKERKDTVNLSGRFGDVDEKGEGEIETY